MRGQCDHVGANGSASSPEFAPNFYEEGGVWYYEDGRVLASVDFYTQHEPKTIVISEWSSSYPGSGHTITALKWFRSQGYESIVANGVGLIEHGVGDIATAYWEHMYSKGLVDVLLDDDGLNITPAPVGVPRCRI